MAMTREEHRKRHEELHKAFDELAADFVEQTGRRLSTTPLLDLLEWSYQQTINPTEKNSNAQDQH